MAISQKQLEIIEKEIRPYLNNLDWLHTQEVREYGRILSPREGANPKIVDVAALFHDSQKKNEGMKDHDEAGAEFAKRVLADLGIADDFIQAVYHCVSRHSAPWIHNPPWNKKMPMPETIEAKVMFDADMLAQMSYLGIGKNIFDYKDEPFFECMTHALRDIKKYAYENLITDSGKQIGKMTFKKVHKFFNFLDNIKQGEL